jgi:hypothetical protein
MTEIPAEEEPTVPDLTERKKAVMEAHGPSVASLVEGVELAEDDLERTGAGNISHGRSSYYLASPKDTELLDHSALDRDDQLWLTEIHEMERLRDEELAHFDRAAEEHRFAKKHPDRLFHPMQTDTPIFIIRNLVSMGRRIERNRRARVRRMTWARGDVAREAERLERTKTPEQRLRELEAKVAALAAKA